MRRRRIGGTIGFVAILGIFALVVLSGAAESVTPALMYPAIVLLPYFIPSIVAFYRGHHNSVAILVLNILLAWTFVVWVVTLVWACTAVRHDEFD